MRGAEVIANLYEAFGRGDIPAVLGAMDPQIRWHEAESNPYMPSGEPWVGPDAIVAELFVKLGEDWEGFTVTPTSFHDAGDVVCVEGRYTAEYHTTGRSIDAEFCHVWTLKDGRITRFKQYTDTTQWRGAMGASD